VDEALSVGDIFFQQKCFDRIRSFINKGTTLLFVSHSTGTVYSLCTRAILIDGGKILLDDKPKSVIDLYNAKLVQQTSNESGMLKIVEQVKNASSSNIKNEEISIDHSQDMATCGSYFIEDVRIESVKLLLDGKEVQSFISEKNVMIRIRVAFDKAYSDPHVGFQIRNSRGEVVFMTNTFCMNHKIGPVVQGDLVEVAFLFKAALSEGQYTITAGVANEGIIDGQFKQSLVRFQDILSFSVLRNLDSILWSGVYNFNPECKIRRLRSEL
jgi:lipopolysaccharide transport system ATP-binding protein